MLRWLILLSLATSGCMAVLGYEPTPTELAAIRRGEDPRAGEEERTAERREARERREKEGNAGESATSEPRYEEDAEPGPTEGTVLRWLDSATVVIEANAQRETVALAGETAHADSGEEYIALDDRMNRWTYGTPVRLTYPVKDQQGRPIYRDTRGRLVATID
jgi:hypothetical protein